jgi:hypothetical protein
VYSFAAAPAAALDRPPGSPPPLPTTLVGSLDLYDAVRGANLTAARLALGARPPRDGVQSAFRPPPPDVVRATFAAPSPPIALAMTRTAGGVTPAALLWAARDGQAYAVPRAALDPRRPAPGAPGAAAAAAEGLAPYHPDVPLAPGQALTRGARVARVRAFAVSPAALESATLVLALGHDAFGTRVAPAGAFDRLPDDFPKGALAAAVAATAGGAAWLRRAARREALRQKWV